MKGHEDYKKDNNAKLTYIFFQKTSPYRSKSEIPFFFRAAKDPGN